MAESLKKEAASNSKGGYSSIDLTGEILLLLS